MRLARITTIYRKLQPPKGPGPLYFHSRRDPAGQLRAILDPSVIVSENEIRRSFDLMPMDVDLREMTLDEMASYVGACGPIIPFTDNPDGPGRIADIELYRGTRRATEYIKDRTT
jgi:hypothetical protein